MWPSFGLVILVNFSYANSTSSANFRTSFVHGISHRPTDLSLLIEFSKQISFEDFHNLILTELSRAVVHALTHSLMFEYPANVLIIKREQTNLFLK